MNFNQYDYDLLYAACETAIAVIDKSPIFGLPVTPAMDDRRRSLVRLRNKIVIIANESAET